MSSSVPDRARPGAGALPALRPHRQQRHQLPGLLRGGFGVLIALVVPALAAAGQEPPGYGRWETESRSCALTINGSSHVCRSVRLEQNLAGMLSVRFLADGRDPEVAEEELVFVGELEAGQRPMQCSSDGRCEPSLPTRMTVSTVAARRFNDRGLIIGLPSTHLARGQCLLEATHLECRADHPNDGSWLAEARP